MDAQEAAICRR